MEFRQAGRQAAERGRRRKREMTIIHQQQNLPSKGRRRLLCLHVLLRRRPAVESAADPPAAPARGYPMTVSLNNDTAAAFVAAAGDFRFAASAAALASLSCAVLSRFALKRSIVRVGLLSKSFSSILYSSRSVDSSNSASHPCTCHSGRLVAAARAARMSACVTASPRASSDRVSSFDLEIGVTAENTAE